MEIRDNKDKLISIENISTNGEYERKQYNKLEANQKYTITFYAEQYNEGSDNSTYEANYIVYTQEIKTEISISGELEFHSLSKKETGKNLINVESEVNWLSDSLFNQWSRTYSREYDKETGILKIGADSQNSTKFVYDLRDYAGQTVTISFEAQLIGDENNYSVYLQNNKNNQKRTKIENLSSNEYKAYEYTMQLDETGYLGFYTATNQGIYLKNLQVELRR